MFNFEYYETESDSELSSDSIITPNNRWLDKDKFLSKVRENPDYDFCSYTPPRGPNKTLFCSSIASIINRENSDSYINYRCTDCMDPFKGHQIGKKGRGEKLLAFAVENVGKEEIVETNNLFPDFVWENPSVQYSDVDSSMITYKIDQKKDSPEHNNPSTVEIANREVHDSKEWQKPFLKEMFGSCKGQQEGGSRVVYGNYWNHHNSLTTKGKEIFEEDTTISPLRKSTLKEVKNNLNDKISSLWLTPKVYINGMILDSGTKRCSFSPKTGEYEGYLCGVKVESYSDKFWKYRCGKCALKCSSNRGSKLVFDKLLTVYKSAKIDNKDFNTIISDHNQQEVSPASIGEKNIPTLDLSPIINSDLEDMFILVQKESLVELLGYEWYLFYGLGPILLVKGTKNFFPLKWTIYGEFNDEITDSTVITVDMLRNLKEVSCDITRTEEYNMTLEAPEMVLSFLKDKN